MIATMRLPFTADGLGVTARGAGEHITQVRRLAIADSVELTTGDEETCAIVLAGTFDLVGGTTAWPSRGARPTPFGGRPVAVFLPPRTTFAARNGRGEILLVAARQPATPPATGRSALQQSPLLPLAGSGKAFDPTSGEWRPAETFPTAPESLPPRRIQHLAFAGATVERVFAADYKAATLVVDELVVAPQGTFACGQLDLPPRAAECLVYVRADAPATVQHPAGTFEVAGEQALWLRGSAAGLRLTAGAAPAYVVLAHAGK